MSKQTDFDALYKAADELLGVRIRLQRATDDMLSWLGELEEEHRLYLPDVKNKVFDIQDAEKEIIDINNDMWRHVNGVFQSKEESE